MVKLTANLPFSFSSLYFPDPSQYDLFDLISSRGLSLDVEDGTLTLTGSFNPFRSGERILGLVFEDGDGQEIASISKIKGLNESNVSAILDGNSAQVMRKLLGKADLVKLSSGDDKINTFNGHDRIFGKGGDDFLKGGNGKDRIFGGNGEDKVVGGNGNDFLRGHAGDDRLLGGRGKDKLSGDAGTDDRNVH